MRMTIERRIEAPPERVFALSTDFEHAAERIEGIERIEMLTEGPTRVGTRFKETRTFGRREASETMEVTALERDRTVVLEARSCGSHYTSTFHFDPPEQGQATRVRFVFDARPETFLARLLVPLGVLMKGFMRKCITKDLDDLARTAEAETRAA